jgi:hypothetical protein
VNVVTWAPDPVALPPGKVAELPAPPIPLHIRDPTPPLPLAAVSVALGLNVDPSTTSTDEDAARLYVVPPIVTAGALGVMVMPATTTGARLVTGARVPAEEPTIRSREGDAGLYIVPPMVAAGLPGFMTVPEMTTEAVGAAVLASVLVDEPMTGVEWRAGAVLAAFLVVAGLLLAGVDCLPVELEVDCG